MSWGHFKTVNVSVTIEIGIMEISKGSLEPVRGSKLPANVGKDMTADEVCALPQENIQITINFFRGWKTTYFFIVIPNLCTLYLVQMSHLLFRNIKNSLANLFYHCKDEEYQYSLLEEFADSVRQIYSFLRFASCIYVRC